MTQGALSRRDQFALEAMKALMARPDLNVDQVAAQATLQADVMVKRLDSDPREDEGVRDAPADSYETSEGVRVRLVDDGPRPPLRDQVIAALNASMPAEMHADVGNLHNVGGDWYVAVTVRVEGGRFSWTTHFGKGENLSAAVADFVSRARRALA